MNTVTLTAGGGGGSGETTAGGGGGATGGRGKGKGKGKGTGEGSSVGLGTSESSTGIVANGSCGSGGGAEAATGGAPRMTNLGTARGVGSSSSELESGGGREGGGWVCRLKSSLGAVRTTRRFELVGVVAAAAESSNAENFQYIPADAYPMRLRACASACRAMSRPGSFIT